MSLDTQTLRMLEGDYYATGVQDHGNACSVCGDEAPDLRHDVETLSESLRSEYPDADAHEVKRIVAAWVEGWTVAHTHDCGCGCGCCYV